MAQRRHGRGSRRQWHSSTRYARGGSGSGTGTGTGMDKGKAHQTVTCSPRESYRKFAGIYMYVPYSRVVTPPLLKRNFALKRGGGRNNENCIYLCVVTPPLSMQQYRGHSPVPHVRSLPPGNKRTHLAKITT